jgi:hypothetical protein
MCEKSLMKQLQAGSGRPYEQKGNDMMKTKMLAVALALAAVLAAFATAAIDESSDAALNPSGSGSNANGSVVYYLTDDQTPIPLLHITLNSVQHPFYSIKVMDSNDSILITEAPTVGAGSPMSVGLLEYLGQDNTATDGHNLANIKDYKIYFKAHDAQNYGANDYIPLALTTYIITPAVSTTGVTDAEITEGGWVATLDSSSPITVFSGAAVTMTGSSFTVKAIDGTEHTVTASAPPDTTKTDKYSYSFVAWKVGDSEKSGTMNVNSDVTLTANFTATINTHMVVIDSSIVSVKNGETPVVSESQIPYGTVLTIDAKKTGYDPTITVNGTATGSAGEAEYTMATADLFIKATFQAKTFTVTFKAEDIASYTDVDKQETYDSAYTFPDADPVWTGHTFKGWSIDNGATILSSDSIVKIVANTTAKAQWTTNEYTITYSSDITKVTGDSGEISNRGLAKYDTPLTAIITEKTGYTAQLQANGVNVENGSYKVPTQNVYLTVVYTPSTHTLTLEGDAVTGSQADKTKISFQNATEQPITKLTDVAYDTEILVDGASLVIGTSKVTAIYGETSATYDFVFDHWAIVVGAAAEADLANGDKVSGDSTIKAYFTSKTKDAFTVTATCTTEGIACVVTDKMTADSMGILKITNTSGKAYTYQLSDNVVSKEIAEGVFKISGVTSDTEITVTATEATDANLRAFYVSGMDGSKIKVYIETNDNRFPTGAAVTLTGMGYVDISSVRTYFPFGTNGYTVEGQIQAEEESHYNITFTLKNLYGKTFSAYSVTATYNGDGKSATTSQVLA